MNTFNNDLFRRILNAVVAKGTFHGEKIVRKDQLYQMIGDNLGTAETTIKYWEREKSGGPNPKDTDLRRNLERYLGLSEGALIKKASDRKEITKNMIVTTDFQKTQIMDCYEKMRTFVNNMEIEDEDKYYSLRHEIEIKKLVLPEPVYNSLMTFMDDVVESYIFEEHMPVFTDDEAEYLEDGSIHLKTEAATFKMMANFMETLSELDDKIEAFAEKELKPYLLS